MFYSNVLANSSPQDSVHQKDTITRFDERFMKRKSEHT